MKKDKEKQSKKSNKYGGNRKNSQYKSGVSKTRNIYRSKTPSHFNSKSGMNQSQNMGSTSFKTNQNLERLEKISQKLNNIHFNIENDKNTKYKKNK